MACADKCLKCVTVARSFYGKSFEECARLYTTKKAFRLAWDVAATTFDNVLKDQRPDSGRPMNVRTMRRSGLSMEH